MDKFTLWTAMLQVEKYANALGGALLPLYRARGGSVIEQVIGAGVAASDLMTALAGDADRADFVFRDSDWERVAAEELASFLAVTLLEHHAPTMELKQDNFRLTCWGEHEEDGRPTVAFVSHFGDNAVWARGDQLNGLMSAAWEGSAWCDLKNGKERTLNEPRGLTTSKHLVPLRQIGPYIGEKTLEEVRRACDITERARTVMLIGPTGAGKTTLVMRSLPEGSRTIRVSAQTLSEGGVLRLLQVLAPDAVLVDDIELSGYTFDRTIAHTLEELHRFVRLVIITCMRDEINSHEDLEPGLFYSPGMRPGRVDRVIFIQPPDEALRRRIALLHLPDERWASRAEEIAAATDGLTAPFIREVCLRVAEGEPIADAVRNIRLHAPGTMSGGRLHKWGQPGPRVANDTDEEEDW